MPLPLLSVFSLIPFKGWLAIGLTGAILGAVWYHKHEIGERDDLIAERDKTIATRDITIANQSISIGQERLNVTMALSEIDEQNRAIESMELKAKQMVTASSLATVRAFNLGRAAAEDILSSKVPTPSNHEEATKAANAILDRMRTP